MGVQNTALYLPFEILLLLDVEIFLKFHPRIVTIQFFEFHSVFKDKFRLSKVCCSLSFSIFMYSML